jgi:hypothetical protein
VYCIITLIICLLGISPLIIFWAPEEFFCSPSSTVEQVITRHNDSLPSSIPLLQSTNIENNSTQHDLLMAKFESDSSPQIANFDADAFDIAADNCASNKTCTPFLANLYESEPVPDVSLRGVGSATCTHKGKAWYKYINDHGHKVIIDDHDVRVCPVLHSCILLILNWNRQNTINKCDDKTHISSYGDLSYLFTNNNRSHLSIRHHSEVGIPIFHTHSLWDQQEYSIFQACISCNHVQINANEEDSDFSTPCCSQQT